MTTELAITTMAYGSQAVPLQRRPHWRPVPRCPYRRLKELTPTSRWFELPAANAETLWETHVAQELGAPIPPAALAAQEWINAGARSAYVVEAWEGRQGVMRADWYGAGSDEPIHGLIDQFMAASDGRIGGFPDVVAFWDDGRINLQELKLSGKDALSAKQHQAADRLRDLLGTRAQLSVLEWGQG